MTVRDKQNFGQLYTDLTKLIDTHIEKMPPHEVGHTLIAIATEMMLENSSNHIVVLKLCNEAINKGIDDWIEDNVEYDKPHDWGNE